MGSSEQDSIPDQSLHASSPANPPSDYLSSSLKSARALVLLQILTRLITFSLSQALVRIASPKVFGTAALQFDLLCQTVLFLSREGVRNVAIRLPTANREQSNPGDAVGIPTANQTRNLLKLPFIAATTLALVFSTLYLYTAPATTLNQPHFLLSLAVYLSATLLEVFTEPLYLRALMNLDTKVRVSAEGAGVIAKAVTTLLGLKLAGETWALVSFAVGQLVYASMLLGRYAMQKGVEIGDLNPWLTRESLQKTTSAPAVPLLDKHSLGLVSAVTLQSVVKHLLTEGDRIVVARASPLEDQGGYAVVTAYGSLLARTIFAPVEESSKLYFSKSFSSLTPNSPASASLAPFRILTLLLRTTVLLLVACPSFIPPLLPLIIPYILPRQYLATSAPSTLQAYLAVYIPILSLNGILEAFFAGTAGSTDVGSQGLMMVFCSGAFGMSLLGLSHLKVPNGHRRINPETSLVYANSLQMGLRILYAWRHAKKVFKRVDSRERLGVWSILPNLGTWVAVASAAVGLRVLLGKFGKEEMMLKEVIGLVGIGGVAGIGCLSVYFLEERRRWKWGSADNGKKDR